MGRLRRALPEADAPRIAIGVAVGLAVFYGVATVVTGLLFPIVAIFVGDRDFELNAFHVDSAEFKYGIAIEYLAIVAVVVALGLAYRAWESTRKRVGDDARDCPECTMSIPTAAKRCPYCTTVLTG